MKNEKIDLMLKFFTISTAAFEFAEKVKYIWKNNNAEENPMYELHKIALHELEKELPDIKILDSLLEQMEVLAEKNRVIALKKKKTI